MPDDRPPRDGFSGTAADSSPRILPHNVEAEHALLGALLVASDLTPKVVRILDEEDFFDPVHGRVFGMIAKMHAKRVAADALTVWQQMRDDEGLQELGGGKYLDGLAKGTVSLRAVTDYAMTVRELAMRRAIITAAENMRADAEQFDVDRDPDTIVTDAEVALRELMTRMTATTRPAAVSFQAAASDALRHALDATKGKSSILSPWPALNTLTGGFIEGGLYVIGGRPGMGKSAVSCEIARFLMGSGMHVVMHTLEMPPSHIVLRIAAAYAHENRLGTVAYRRFLQGMASEEEVRRWAQGINPLVENWRGSIIDTHIRGLDRSCAEIRAQVGAARRRGERVGAVIIDYLGLLSVANPRANNIERVTEITRTLKGLAGELNVPLIALSQLSRAVENREDKRPVLSDLRESGSVEQDADAVVFAYREEEYLRKAEPSQEDTKWAEWRAALDRCEGCMDLIVAKQRHGPQGTAELRCDLSVNAIWDAGSHA